LLVIGGSASTSLAEKVAQNLGAPNVILNTKKFPDGEKYVRIPYPVKGEDVAVIQSTGRRPDEYLMEYFLIADTLRDLGARKVFAVIPYFAYARQDKCFNPGEALSFETIAKMIEKVGTSEVYTIDIHLHRVTHVSKLFTIPAYNLTAVPLLAEYIQKNFDLVKPMIVGPDEEAGQWAKTASKVLGISYDVLEKRRLGPDKVEIKPRTLAVANRDVIIIDDIISTGGTIIEAVSAVKKEGARRVIVACTHPILVNNALEKIYETGADHVIGTDTLPTPISYVSVAPVIADAIKEKQAT